MTRIAIQNSYLEKGHKVDVLIVVGGRKSTDEEMLKCAKDLFFDDKY
jgi:translation initiation factor IF-3